MVDASRLANKPAHNKAEQAALEAQGTPIALAAAKKFGIDPKLFVPLALSLVDQESVWLKKAKTHCGIKR